MKGMAAAFRTRATVRGGAAAGEARPWADREGRAAGLRRCGPSRAGARRRSAAGGSSEHREADILARGALRARPVTGRARIRARTGNAGASCATPPPSTCSGETVAEYRATVHRSRIEVGVHGARDARDRQRVGVPAGFLDLGLPVIEDQALTVAELDELDAVVTGQRARDRRHRDDRARRPARLRPPRAYARARPHLPGRRRPPSSPPCPDAVAALGRRTDHARLRALRHVGHRARPRRRRARPHACST